MSWEDWERRWMVLVRNKRLRICFWVRALVCMEHLWPGVLRRVLCWELLFLQASASSKLSHLRYILLLSEMTETLSLLNEADHLELSISATYQLFLSGFIKLIKFCNLFAPVTCNLAFMVGTMIIIMSYIFKYNLVFHCKNTMYI